MRSPRLVAAAATACLVLGTFDSAAGQDQQAPGRCLELPRGAQPVSLLIVTGGHPFEASEFFHAFDSMKHVRYSHLIIGQYSIGATADQTPLSFPPGGLQKYDVILFYDFEQGKVSQLWRDVLSRGKGYVFLHHAIGLFPASPEMKDIMGGHVNFFAPVEGLSTSGFRMNVLQHYSVVDPSHPITCGTSSFDLLDEVYETLDVAPGAHLILRSDQPSIEKAAGWTWSFDGKRVVYLQPGHGNVFLPEGHGPSSYQSEPFKRILERAIYWAAGALR